jgi:hypothetical protein
VTGRAELARYPGRCANPDCRHELELVVVVDLTAIEMRLAALERLVRSLGGKIMGDIHTEIHEAIQPVLDAVDAVSTDVARELADFAALVAPKLSDEEQAQFAGLAQRLLDLDAAVNAADPAPVDEGGQPVDEPVPAAE